MTEPTPNTEIEPLADASCYAFEAISGDQIKRWRSEAGETQEQFSKRIGVSRAYLAKLEVGMKRNIGMVVIFGLVRELGISVKFQGAKISPA